MAYDGAIDDSGNVYVTGASWGSGSLYDYATVKYDANGNQMWVARYAGIIYGIDKAYSITLDDAGYVYVTGESPGAGTAADYVTIKYSQATGVAENISRNNIGMELTVSNSIFKENVEICCKISDKTSGSLRIYDATGRIVIDLSSKLKSLQSRIIWNGINSTEMIVSPGTYFIKLATSSGSINKKIVKIE
jgi:small nuclear ribonucleoprotein (snRNP)-like protein